MAYRRKTYKKKKRFGKKRAFKKTVKKVYRRRRSFKKKRVTRRSSLKINGSLNLARFKVRVNRRDLELGDDPKILALGNAADLAYTKLAANLPIINQYNQYRIDRIVTHWRVKNRNRTDWRGDIVNHALVYKVPNDSTGPDATLEPLMFSTDTAFMNNMLQNYAQLTGVNFKKVSPFGGSYAYRPYVTEQITTLSKTSTAAPVVAQDLRRNYSRTFRYASSAVQYEAPVYIVMPGFTKRKMLYAGTLGTGTVKMDEVIEEWPQMEIWNDIYITCKQSRQFSVTNPPARRLFSTNPEINEINTDFNKIKEDVQESVMDQISNSHPVLGAVAAIAGLRKRPRDEFKM